MRSKGLALGCASVDEYLYVGTMGTTPSADG